MGVHLTLQETFAGLELNIFQNIFQVIYWVCNENYKEGSKFETGDHIKTLKYKNIVAKGYVPNCPQKKFVIKMVKNIVICTFVIGDFNGEEMFGTFYKK